ncbi:MAG: S9 family peptidase [Gemmatimonadota bacterium]|nr:MAG: S9 family peptidase [Gemmatimonadota bacterium]
MKRVLCISALFLALAFSLFAQDKNPITFDDLFGMGRVSDPQISPDGERIAYTVTWYDYEENKGNSDIWLVPIDSGEPIQLTTSPEGDSHPRWSPDGKSIAFISSRTGTSQVWMIPADGGEAKQMTTISTGASGVEWSPDGKHLLFTSEVYPDCPDDPCNKARDEEKEESKVQARLIDKLLYRHWNVWREGKVSHLFIVPDSGGVGTDLTPGERDVPPISLGSDHDYTFSPQGKEICFVMNPDPMVAISTNNDLFTIPTTGGQPKRITTSKANDNQPQYSPDGRYIAYHAMERPGFEADRYQLMLYDRHTGEMKSLSKDFDYTVEDIVWSPDSKTIYFTVPDRAYTSICSVPVTGGTIRKIVTKSLNDQLRLTPDGRNFVFRHQEADLPSEIFKADITGKKLTQLTRTNEERLSQLEMNALEEFWFIGAKGDSVHGLLLRPPDFDPGRRWPLIYLIHGGPQGAWEDEFHYRWNYQMFASPGYVVAAVNFHASTGYGQEFTDAVSRDWGGAPYEDLMKGIDYLTSTYDFIDVDRMGAAGASYGGFMINWLAGHNHPFKCFVNHDGVYDQVSMYGGTEELWFLEWEFGGTPWDNPEEYERWSPSTYAKNFKTPMLVVHGENDFRVPNTQGFQVFTALQRHGVPSKLLYFPDEDHFVRKPQNAELWWKTVHEWFAEYLK